MSFSFTNNMWGNIASAVGNGDVDGIQEIRTQIADQIDRLHKDQGLTTRGRELILSRRRGERAFVHGLAESLESGDHEGAIQKFVSHFSVLSRPRQEAIMGASGATLALGLSN